jgi:hypothetical protein
MSAKFPPRPAKEPLTGKEAAESTLARFPRIVERLRDSGSPTTPSEKHLETARAVFHEAIKSPAGQEVATIAAALAQAERDGMKRAAEQCKRYRDETASLDDCLPKIAANNASMIIQNYIISLAGEE